MVFRRNKNKKETTATSTPMRGRDSLQSETKDGSDSHQNPLARRFLNDDEPDTMDLEQPARFHESVDEEHQETTTRLLTGDDSVVEAQDQEIPQDPVTGFLVVVTGPGRGSISILGYGVHSIGRDASQRICLDHGDLKISRKHHCLVTFDSLASKFYIQPGEGRNLVYLNDQPVLLPGDLVGGEYIRLGDTVLRFVPLCGDDFSWETKV